MSPRSLVQRIRTEVRIGFAPSVTHDVVRGLALDSADPRLPAPLEADRESIDEAYKDRAPHWSEVRAAFGGDWLDWLGSACDEPRDLREHAVVGNDPLVA